LKALAWCLLLLHSVFAQGLSREQIVAAYIFNFAKNIEWREEGAIPEFRFLIISDDVAINHEMSALAASKKVKGKPINIDVSESVDIPKGVQLIFIARGLKDLTGPVFRRIEGQNILLITDGSDDKRFAMINLIGTKVNTIRFEINKANIINQGLKVLPDMVLLGGTEIDVAKLYKESQDTLRIEEGKIADLQRHLDSLDALIGNAHKEIEKQNLRIEKQNSLIARQVQDIAGQQNQLGKQRDTLSQQTGLLSKSQQMLKQQQVEMENGKAVLSDQQKRIDNQNAFIRGQNEAIYGQNAAILKQRKVLGERNTVIAIQKNIQRFLILIIILVLGLSYTIYRSYKAKQLSNKRLQEQKDELHEMLGQLKLARDKAQTANKELEAFSYSVSHDLRAPLRSIDGFSQAILEDYAGEIDERGKDYLRRVRSAARRMAQLIDDMLNLSRVTRNEMVLRKIDLSGMAKEIAEKLRGLQPERQVEFIIHPDIVVKGDEHLLRIALENLFDNAWKYTSKQPTARIEFGSRILDRKPAAFVKDDGAGFDMNYAQKLFGAFQRMHTAEEFPGTGIGLATVQRIINRHGGEIRAESEPGKGATFYFSIPDKEA
jgi:signal transduction histidine kinase